MNRQNLYNSAHIAANSKSRAGFDHITWDTDKKCWRCNGQRYILIKGAMEDYNVSCPECG